VAELEAEIAELRRARRLEVELEVGRGALRESEARAAALASEHAAVLGQIAEGVIVTDAAGRITFVNEAAAGIHGAAVLGIHPEAYSAAYYLLTEDGRPYPAEELPLARAVMRGETVTDARWRIRRPDGSVVLAVGTARPVYAPDRTRIGAVLTLRDETARDQAERALRESEARFRAVFDQQFQFMAVLSPEGVTLEINDLPLRITGIMRGQVVGRLFWETPFWAGLPAIREAWPGRLAEATRADGPVLSEDLYQTADGIVRVADAAITAVRGPDGALRFFVIQASDTTERRQAEAALRESEALKRAILDAALDCVVTIDHQSRVVEWNPAAERTFGYPREAVLGRDMAELIIPPELREEHRRGLARYLTAGKGPVLGRRVEVEALRADGSCFPVELAITPTSVGGRTLFTAHLRDITERKAAEAALAESEARSRAVADNIPQLAWMAEPDGRRIWYNRRWYEYTGQTPEEARDWGWRWVQHPDHLERVLEGTRRAWETGEPWEDTFPLRRYDGDYRWFLTRAVPVRDAKGLIAFWFGTNTDVTAQQEAEAALTAHAAEFRAIFETAAAGVTEVNLRTGRYLRVNRRFCEIVGRTEQELLGGLGPDDLSHPEDRGANAAALAAAAADGRYELERRYLRSDGIVVWVRASAAVAARDETGQATRTVAVVQDITERKRAEQRQSLLVAELNHRVKNALATVQALADQTLRGADGDPGRFVTDFTARLRTLARAHDLLTRRGWEPAGLGEVARAALELWLEEGGDCRVSLAGTDEAMVSPRQAQALVLALHELATNAAKHGALSRPGGRVELCGRMGAGGVLTLEWSETGGPPVAGPPVRRGFGTRLLERGLPQDLGPSGFVKLCFEPGGLRAVIRFSPPGASA
jgi:PAS domain S-box-containing protein